MPGDEPLSKPLRTFSVHYVGAFDSKLRADMPKCGKLATV